jgi:hypothetical protein
MFKKLGVSGCVVAVAALAVGSVAPAAGTGKDDDNGDHRSWIKVVSTNTEEEFIDVGTPDFSLGDQFVFTSELTKHGKTVGHAGVVCTITSVAAEEAQCVGTAWFDKHGQIAIQGLLAGEPRDFSFPITGGTRDFEDAGGTLFVHEISDTKELLAFHIED